MRLALFRKLSKKEQKIETQNKRHEYLIGYGDGYKEAKFKAERIVDDLNLGGQFNGIIEQIRKI